MLIFRQRPKISTIIIAVPTRCDIIEDLYISLKMSVLLIFPLSRNLYPHCPLVVYFLLPYT